MSDIDSLSEQTSAVTPPKNLENLWAQVPLSPEDRIEWFCLTRTTDWLPDPDALPPIVVVDPDANKRRAFIEKALLKEEKRVDPKLRKSRAAHAKMLSKMKTVVHRSLAEMVSQLRVARNAGHKIFSCDDYKARTIEFIDDTANVCHSIALTRLHGLKDEDFVAMRVSRDLLGNAHTRNSLAFILDSEEMSRPASVSDDYLTGPGQVLAALLEEAEEFEQLCVGLNQEALRTEQETLESELLSIGFGPEKELPAFAIPLPKWAKRA